MTNVILNKGTGAAKNDLAQGVDGKTIFEGVNKVLSGISGKGTIENKGYFELNGSENYGFVGEFIQNSANAVTKVVGNNFNSSVYFGGTSTITDGILWWMTTDQGGKLNMSGSSQLIIGDLDNNNFTGEGEYKLKLANGGNTEAASKVGELLAKRAKNAKIENVIFDRGGYQYHGRVKALAESARENGLKF